MDKSSRNSTLAMNDSILLQIAKQAAFGAGEEIKKVKAQGIAIQEKLGQFDIVTEADNKSEAKILQIIQTNFPNHNILAEEGGEIKKDKDIHSEYTWVIDPLDGTTLFTAGLPEYCVAIGLLKMGKPYLGVILRVATGETYWAERGKGAFKNGEPIHVSNTKEYSKSVIASDYQNTKEQRFLDQKRNNLLGINAKSFRTGTGSVNTLALLAEGKVTGFVHVCKIWDFVAASAIIQEAGGKVTNWQGNNIDWNKEWIEAIFSNGLIHNQIIDVLKDLE